MDSAYNLEYVFKLLFLEHSHRNINELISLIDSISKTTEVRESGELSNDLEKVLTSIELLLKIFNSNYESRFNVFIEYIFDQIRNILQFGIENNILSTLPLKNIINVIDVGLDISISRSCKGGMAQLAGLYTLILNSMKNGNISSPEEELMFKLGIIPVFYEVVNKKCVQNQAENFKSINDEYCECDLFAKLVFNSSKAISAQTLINIVPVYIKYSESNNILKCIWDEISQSLDQQSYKYSIIFTVLCYLSDLYFAAHNKTLINDMFKSKNYWTLLQKGLMHFDSSVRKQALFLLKKSCHYLKDHQLFCVKQEENVFYSSNMIPNCEILFKCDSEGIFDVLKELWCIIEYLEEKQIHLLKPMLDVIDSFLAANGKNLHISWRLIIIQRMISHDNMTIIKKGFSNMLNIPISAYNNEEILKDAIKILVSTLSCTQLYSSHWQVVTDELKIYFDACSRQGNGKEFFKLLLNEISKVRWSPEALFFVTYSLQSVEQKNYWGRNEFDLIKKILNGTVNHYTYVKSAIQWQLLNTSINFLDNHVTLDDIASLITCFVRRICLQRNNKLWRKIVKWVRGSFEAEDVENFLKKFIIDNTTSVNIGKMILILYDAYRDDGQMTQKIRNLLNNILATFSDVYVRPYFDVEAQEFYQSLVYDFMEESYGDSELLKIFSPSLPDILKYIEIGLDSVHHIRDFRKSQDLMKTLKTVLKFGKDDSATLEVISKWFEKIIKNLILEPVELLPLQKFVYVKTLTIIIVNNLDFMSHPEIEFVGPYLKSELSSPLEKTSEDMALTEDLQNLRGKMNSEYLKHKWELLSYIMDSSVDVLNIGGSDFLHLCLEAVDTGGSAVLLPLIGALGKALPSLLSESRLRQMMDSVLSVMMERKKNDDFYHLAQSYIQITFQSNVIETREENIREMLLDHSQQLFSENNVNVANIFVKHIQNLEFHTQSGYFYLYLLPRALLFGQIQRREERLVSNICTLIENENLSPLMNDFSTNVDVRARAINIVLSLNKKNQDHCKFAEDLIDALIKLEENINKNKVRYFADSHAHRYKERLIQSLLLLENYISQDKSHQLWKWVCDKIILENNQPSVRYLQEWLILRLMYHNLNLKNSLWKYFDEGIEKRTGSLCSLITIVYHSLKCIPKTEMETWIDNSVQKFLPYCMAQHFTVRLYAQVTLQKLMNLTRRLNLIRIIEKYGDISEILSQSIESGNAVKNCAKMREDFYFTVFDPVEHYSLETIFYEFPRLTSAGFQELIPTSLFEQYGIDEKNCSIPLKNKDDSLKFFACGKWIVDGSNQIDLFGDSDKNKEMELSNLQKKMIPIKHLLPDLEDMVHFLSYNPNNKNNKEGLIVVGSLIDRLPNLGGLCRTCEVFGASEFVIGSLKYLEDQQFKSLSVTAEKWIPITEIKSYHLSDYLVKMKQNGYTILAAEQTVKSQPLGSFKFPKKSILLLGNEKEGIPPTLLPLTDICIEIPQNGIIRSLNVHVTGALFIWEYAKQHTSL